MLKTFSVTVIGKVQGVFFRQNTREKALELGIVGFVRNQRAGSVSIMATGTGDQLDKLIAWCKLGPMRAEVSDVQVEEVTLQPFTNFTVQK